MRRLIVNPRIETVLMLLLCSAVPVACKTREPEQSGLLAADTEQISADETVADGGEFAVRCGPTDDADSQGAEANSGDTYVLQVKGAVSLTDEAQPLMVDLDVFGPDAGAKPQRLYAGQRGRGVVDLQKSVFIGFENGVLTAEAVEGNTGIFAGVLSIAGRTDGMQVRCQAKALTPDPE